MQCEVCNKEITPMNGPLPGVGYNFHDLKEDKLIYCCSGLCVVRYLKEGLKKIKESKSYTS